MSQMRRSIASIGQLSFRIACNWIVADWIDEKTNNFRQNEYDQMNRSTHNPPDNASHSILGGTNYMRKCIAIYDVWTKFMFILLMQNLVVASRNINLETFSLICNFEIDIFLYGIDWLCTSSPFSCALECHSKNHEIFHRCIFSKMDATTISPIIAVTCFFFFHKFVLFVWVVPYQHRHIQYTHTNTHALIRSSTHTHSRSHTQEYEQNRTTKEDLEFFLWLNCHEKWMASI